LFYFEGERGRKRWRAIGLPGKRRKKPAFNAGEMNEEAGQAVSEWYPDVRDKRFSLSERASTGY